MTLEELDSWAKALITGQLMRTWKTSSNPAEREAAYTVLVARTGGIPAESEVPFINPFSVLGS